MVESHAGKPNAIGAPQIADFPYTPLEGRLRVRFNEILEARRKQNRELRHNKRVEVLRKAAENGELVFNSRIEIVGEEVFVEPH